MRALRRQGWLVLAVGMAMTGEAHAAELRGSRASMQRQHRVAETADLSFMRTDAEVDRLVVQGALEPVWGGRDYTLANVSYPYARPEVRLFVERLAARYREATGQQLVVTSLTRPAARQPGNAHDLSVHPAGMAVDLRVPADPRHRAWLEEALLELEVGGVLDVTRERRPPHYHVAVFPAEYRAHEARMEAAAALTRAAREAERGLGVRLASSALPQAMERGMPGRGGAGDGAATLLFMVLSGMLALGLSKVRRLGRPVPAFDRRAGMARQGGRRGAERGTLERSAARRR